MTVNSISAADTKGIMSTTFKNDNPMEKVNNAANIAVAAGATMAAIANGLAQDTVEFKNEENAVSIDPVRAFTKMLTDEQIENLNKNKKLAKGTVFQKNENGDYDIKNDLFGTTKGTRTLPDGYEVKKNVFGIAKVVPVGTKDIFMNE